MAERALDDLLAIMRDQRVGMRDRINASISASRVSALTLPGESEPEAVVFLRWIIDFDGGQKGERFSPSFRREAAAALSFWQRRAAKMALTYEVPDQTERAAGWRKLINGAIRLHLSEHDLWPARRDILLTAAEEIVDVASLPDPERVLSALMLPAGGNRHARRRLKAIDERLADIFLGTEAERLALIKPLALLAEARLAEFGLGPSMGQQQPHHQTAAQTLAP